MGANPDHFSVKAENEVSNEAGNYAIRTRFFAPPAEYEGCFSTFYQLALDCEDGGTIHDFLQPEWANIRFFAHAAPHARIGDTAVRGAAFTATGPSSLPCEFELGTTRMWGIGLLPLGWARFMNDEAASLANGVWDGSKHPAFAGFDQLTDVLCDADVPTGEKLAFIHETLGRLMRPSRDEAKILRVHDALVNGDHLAVADLADACAMSIRTLERVCSRYFGFTPKRLMRRQRFMRSLTTFMLHGGHQGRTRWTEVMDGEYHDQAQFTREFTEFMTMTPSKYASLDHPILASFMEARARVWGSAAQTLDQPRRDEASEV